MAKDISVVVSGKAHEALVTRALPKAIEVLEQTMNLDPFDEVVDPKTKIVTRTFNGRINSQRLRAALGTVQVVERLGDQALRRQAGGQLKSLLKAIRERKPELFDKKVVVVDG